MNGVATNAGVGEDVALGARLDGQDGASSTNAEVVVAAVGEVVLEFVSVVVFGFQVRHAVHLRPRSVAYVARSRLGRST